MENVCDFCEQKYKNVCDDRKVTIDDLLKVFRNDIIVELFALNKTWTICSDCMQQLQDCYVFIQKIKDAAMRLKLSSQVQEVENDSEDPKELVAVTDISMDTLSECNGTEASDKELVCNTVEECADSLILNKATPVFKRLLPKTSDMECTLKKSVDAVCPSSSYTSRLYKCLECAESFKSFKHLRDHESGPCSNTSITGVFICKYCHLCFKDAKAMAHHQSLKHSEQQFLCCLCGDKVFTSKGYLTRHIDKIHDHASLQYFCGECEIMLHLPSQEAVKTHFNDMHPPEDTSDEKSQEPLNEEDMDLEMHEEFLDEFLLAHTNENSFQFSECWEALDLHLPDMLQQSTSFHNSDELSEAFSCPKCFEQFRNPQPLLKHLAETHNLPVLICRTCRKSFASFKLFKMHINNKCKENNTSSNILSIPCPYCSKSFSSSLSLKQHLRIVHTQHKKHICQLCDKQYSTLDHLKKHVLSQHQNERKHTCHLCTKSFTQLCHLKQHLAIHTKGKSIECTECPEKFWRKVDMQRHQTKVHDGIKGNIS